MFGLVTLLGAGLALFAEEGVRRTVRTLTRPPRRTYAWAVARGRPGDPGELRNPRPFREWTFRSRGRDLPVWDIDGERPSGPLVIVTHGWGDSRVTMLSRVEVLAAHASRVLVWDLPGHGEALGRCTLGAEEPEDLKALLARAAELASGVPIVLYGFSLGAGISIEVAASSGGVGAVISEAPYRFAATPAGNVLRLMGMPYRWNLPAALWLIGLGKAGKLRPEVFDRASHAARLGVPLLVVHGDSDETCPVADGQAIARSGGGEIRVIETGRHLTLWTDDRTRDATVSAVGAFLGSLAART